MARVLRKWQLILGVAIAASGAAGCTLNDATAPPLQGPSELSLAFVLAAVPDILTQDGASQSQILIQARDANGQPARSITFRVDTTVNGVLADFGSLSARTLVTGSDGRATVTYTAPRSVTSVDVGQRVTIQVTPFGTDFNNSEPRRIDIRLIPPGVLLPGGPVPPAPAFTVAPASPAAFENAVFDASGWTPAVGTQIVSYSWNFGDGTTGSGVQAFHRFTNTGTFLVALTVTDTNNVSVTSQAAVTVGAGAVPSAAFVFSPSTPQTNQDIFFDATTSQAGAGHSIARYDWNFGSGAPRTGVTVTKSYDQAGTYAVVLTVTDEAGQTNSVPHNVVVSDPGAANPTARFTISPSPAGVMAVVEFDGAGSTSTFPASIIRYQWNFGDGSIEMSSTPGSTKMTHQYGSAGNKTITLTVTDSLGRQGSVTHTLVVQ